MRNYLKNQKGQAAMEFIAVVLVVFFLLLFYLSIALLLVVSGYMDYATFMTARTYKAGFSTEQFQESYAREIFNKYADKVTGIIRNPRLNFISTNAESEQGKGVISSYQLDLFYLPPIFLGANIPNGRLNLFSEAMLGRDPTNEDCKNFFRNFSQRYGLGINDSNILEMMDDNGC
jgi:hypothetical protein